MRTWLKVDFHATFICLNGVIGVYTFADRAAKWVSDFGPGFSTGLLTLQQTEALLYPSGTLYVSTEGVLTSDNLPGLSGNWSRDCIVVDAVTVVSGPPDAQTEQAAVNAANPPGGSLTDGFTKFIHDAEHLVGVILKDAALVVLVLLILFVVLETKPWKYGVPTFKRVKKVFV